jgi:hypothetical protein
MGRTIRMHSPLAALAKIVLNNSQAKREEVAIFGLRAFIGKKTIRSYARTPCHFIKSSS